MMLECNYAQSNIFSCTDKKEVFLSCCSLGSASTTRNHQVRRKRKSRRFSCSCWVLVHKRRTWLRPNFLCKQTGIRQTNFMLSWLGMTCIDIFYVFDLFIESSLYTTKVVVILCIQRPYSQFLLTLHTNSLIRKYSPMPSEWRQKDKCPWWWRTIEEFLWILESQVTERMQ